MYSSSSLSDMLGDDSVMIQEADSTTYDQDEDVEIIHDISVTTTEGEPDVDIQEVLTLIMTHMLGRMNHFPVVEWLHGFFQETGVESVSFRSLGTDENGQPRLGVQIRDYPLQNVALPHNGAGNGALPDSDNGDSDSFEELSDSDQE